MECTLDHLVVLAASLQDGVAWCEATLGVVPGPGGKHALMGTHNRLLAIGSAAFPKAYLEIIAIDPDAPSPGRARWFGMDDPALQARVAREGPRLHHAVVRSVDAPALRQGLVDHGLDPGELLQAERATPAGLLRWRIVVRADGAIAAAGALPTLIAWDGIHPTDAMPRSAVSLQRLNARELPGAALGLLPWAGPRFVPGPAPLLQAVFDTPRGEVTVSSPA